MDDRRRDGGANSISRIKEQETHLTLHEHDDDNDDDDDDEIKNLFFFRSKKFLNYSWNKIVTK